MSQAVELQTSDNIDVRKHARTIGNSFSTKIERVKIEYLLGMSIDHLIRRMRAQTSSDAKDNIALKMLDKHLPNIIQHQMLNISVNLTDSLAQALIDIYHSKPLQDKALQGSQGSIECVHIDETPDDVRNNVHDVRKDVHDATGHNVASILHTAPQIPTDNSSNKINEK